jgi:hypothetical protein
MANIAGEDTPSNFILESWPINLVGPVCSIKKMRSRFCNWAVRAVNRNQAVCHGSVPSNVATFESNLKKKQKISSHAHETQQQSAKTYHFSMQVMDLFNEDPSPFCKRIFVAVYNVSIAIISTFILLQQKKSIQEMFGLGVAVHIGDWINSVPDVSGNNG